MSLELHIEHLRLGPRVLVTNLKLGAPGGAIHTLMGPSGCGKSSVLAVICGTLSSAFDFEGSIALGGKPLDALPTEARRIGLLFQDDLLFAHMSVRENLLFAVPPGPRSNVKRRCSKHFPTWNSAATAMPTLPACPTASVPAWPWCAPCSPSLRRSCWTSLSPGWTLRCAGACASLYLPRLRGAVSRLFWSRTMRQTSPMHRA